MSELVCIHDNNIVFLRVHHLVFSHHLSPSLIYQSLIRHNLHLLALPP